ncbi:MAG: hypothetical protein WAK18_02210 [Nocardioidaceae bacterium]
MTDDVPRSRPLIALMLIAAAPVTVALTYLVVRGTLPDNIPHEPSWWGWLATEAHPGSVALSGTSFAAFVSGVTLVMYLRGYNRDRGYTWMKAAVFLNWLTPGAAIATLIASVGAPSYDAAVHRWWAFPLQLAFLLVPMMLVNKIIHAVPVSTGYLPIPDSSLRLEADERAVWTGSAYSMTAYLSGLMLAAVGLACMVVWPLVGTVAFLGLVRANQSLVRVRIDGHGVHPRSRWLNTRFGDIPLVAIASAEVTNHLTRWQDYNRVDWEKKDREVTQLLVRPGPALSLRLHSGKRHSISLDHADAAADVVNALVARHRRLTVEAPAAAEPGQGRR